jgi:hypothetical protein
MPLLSSNVDKLVYPHGILLQQGGGHDRSREVIVFLLSTRESDVSGTILAIDGGITAG